MNCVKRLAQSQPSVNVNSFYRLSNFFFCVPVSSFSYDYYIFDLGDRPLYRKVSDNQLFKSMMNNLKKKEAEFISTIRRQR